MFLIFQCMFLDYFNNKVYLELLFFNEPLKERCVEDLFLIVNDLNSVL